MCNSHHYIGNSEGGARASAFYETLQRGLVQAGMKTAALLLLGPRNTSDL